ncbi:MAG: hypothetical protein NTW03_02760, partial [Verrucomicrobia bacterium]|nr:hypothetical protein [Verrucomicrobiota bacterium]
AGNLYVADTYNSTIRKLTPDGLVVTVAGFARNSRSTDGSGGNARFYYPSDLAVDRAGTVYVADTRNHTVRKGVPYTGQIIILSPPQDRNVTVTYSSNLFTPVVCGLPPLTYEWRKNGMNLPGATNSTLLLPNVASNDSGAYSVVISHPGESVTSTPPATLTVSPALSVITLAGRADVPGSADGLGKEARFGWPWGLALDSAGNVYAADSEYQTIRKLTPRGMVTTVAGQAGEYGTDDGLGNVARFQDPAGVAADSKGNLYVAD